MQKAVSAAFFILINCITINFNYDLIMSDLKKSSKNILNQLELEYRKSLIKVDMEIFQARQTRMKSKIQRYFNSTPIRNAFARWMVYAYYNKVFYTITQLVREMSTNRQTVSLMISECEVENYITVQRKGKTVGCRATLQLVKAMDEYSDWRKMLIEKTIYQPYINLKQFERFLKKSLDM